MVESVSLQDIWKIIKETWIVIVAVALAAALVFALYTSFFIPKKYTSAVTLYVSNTANTSTGNKNSSDINASKLLANTCVQLLTKAPARDQICEMLKAEGFGDVTPAKLGNYVTIKQTEDTELLMISAVTENNKLSAEICNAYAAVAPEYLKDIIEAGAFKVIDEAVPSVAPSSPNLVKNAIIGGLLGAFVSFGVYFLIFLFDNTVKDSETLKKKLNVPVLGEVPTFTGNIKA